MESLVGHFPPTIWAYAQPTGPHNWAAIATGWATPAVVAVAPGKWPRRAPLRLHRWHLLLSTAARAASWPGPRFSPTAQMVARWRRQVVLSAPPAGGAADFPGDMVTKQLEPIQFWKVFDAGERLYPAQGPGYLLHLRHSSVSEGDFVYGRAVDRPDDLLKHRSCSFSEADVGDGRALDNKKVEHEKLSFVEGKLAFIIRISQEH
uniref:Uncharacterized protein n=1 Tax=Oryza glumipatula TaxID=40148 RepID=A0A0E0BLN6_9ORYZ